MKPLVIDHFVVGAASLDTGREVLATALGAPATGGGVHPLMGTHNALWRVGSAYLEVIAINPEIPAPARPRWFGLDDPLVQARLAEGPVLLTWVARSAGLSGDLARCPLDPGPAIRFTRDHLHWHLTVPDDGRPHANGVIPALIEWPEGVDPPSRSLPDSGISVTGFSALVTKTTRAALTAMGAAPLLSLGPGNDRLSLQLSGPAGAVVLDQ